MSDFPTSLHFPIAGYVDVAMDWIIATFRPLFDGISSFLLTALVQLENLLLWLPWWVIVLAVVILGWKATGRWAGGLFLGALMMAVGVFGLWILAMQTLAIVVTAVLVALILGLPLGVFMALSERFQTVARPILDAMQTMPSFVYLLPAFMLFGIGKVPALFATVVYAIPPIIRLTNLGVRQVPYEVVEAAEAFGSTRMQTLFKIQLPLAVPTIMSGVNQTTMMALAMVVIASMIGARGLGEQVLIAIGRIEIGRGFEAGLAIVMMAIIVDRILQGVTRAQQSRIQTRE